MASRSLLSRTIMTPRIVAGTGTTTRRTLMQGRSLGLKESLSKDPSPDEFDKHKQDSLSKQRQGKGHWKPELASESEESVKADRMSPHEAGEAAMKRLQERTKEAAEEKAKHGTSMRDGL
ncbi:hypothetical protein QBC33DRAFT_510739 [Phialemonium atrogriseum]|uniref:Uncharacterized protein n=1 Tax=Phialemonium atrogriseum TaxID=1093897 RepID=A0AAJ0FLT2_9PEZI|nr:uncharacterized protein QBC33DRAFT_510739 [Phialemonium atrogriseum]KAK1772931.1 hypothetical protein QBC33DRAFT_510739 [Phialemonium atrogriseum]